MQARLEIWSEGRSPESITLGETRVSIGRASSNDVALTSDPSVSRLHAVLERYPAGWCVRDLGSANGTDLNGERLTGERLLHAGDEIRVGAARILFKGQDGAAAARTERRSVLPPKLTPRERDVLVALCRPLTGAEAFAQPATVGQIAADLVVTEAAVKFHLGNLYEKFELREAGPGRRARLASEAVARGAVSLADLRGKSGSA